MANNFDQFSPASEASQGVAQAPLRFTVRPKGVGDRWAADGELLDPFDLPPQDHGFDERFTDIATPENADAFSAALRAAADNILATRDRGSEVQNDDFDKRFFGEGVAIPQNPDALSAGLRTAADRRFANRFSEMAIPQNVEELRAGLRQAADQKLDLGPSWAFNSNLVNTALLNIPRNYYAWEISRARDEPFSESYQFVKDVDEASARRNWKSAAAGTTAGIGAGMVALPGIGGGATTVARAGRAALAGAGYGGAAEAFDSKDPVHVAVAATLGAVFGGAGAAAAEKFPKFVAFISGLVKGDKQPKVFLNSNGTLTDEGIAAAKAAGVDPSWAIDPRLGRIAVEIAQRLRAARHAASASGPPGLGVLWFGRKRGPLGGIAGAKVDDWIIGSPDENHGAPAR